MPDQDPYQRSIDQAAKIYGAASESYNAVATQIQDLKGRLAAEDVPTLDAQGNKTGQTHKRAASEIDFALSDNSEYKALNDRLSDLQKRFTAAEQAYQSAIELQDKAKAAAKEVYPAGYKRTRLDTTAGNVLVSLEETADGRGGWNAEPTSIKRVQVAGSQATGTRISAPTSDKFIVTLNDDGSLTQKENPNYQPDKNAGPQAVPTSEFIYQDGEVKPNPAYRPAAPIVNTEAPQIPDPSRPGQFMPNPNYKPPTPPPMTPGQTAVDTATAGVAQPAAEANLAKAQADAKAAQVALEDAQRRARQAPTDQQAQQAIATAQRQADLATQQLEQAIKQAGTLNPVLVEQAQATLDATRANTQKGLQGDLYGRAEQIRQIHALVLSGDVGPAEADSMVSALNRGTSVYQAQVQQQADRSTARGQDLSNKNALAGNFTSAMTSGFGTLADMNKYAVVGSTAGADAFIGLMNIAQDRLKSYELPPAQTTDYLGGGGGRPSNVSGLIGAAQQAVQQPVAPQPVVPIQQPQNPQHVQPITINIGGGVPQTSSGTQGEGNPWAGGNTPAPGTTWQNPAVSGLVSAAAQKVPASEDDIYAAYGVNKPPTATGAM